MLQTESERLTASEVASAHCILQVTGHNQGIQMPDSCSCICTILDD